jgi:DHA2 family multidrug resistance protein-like MFS transporter
MAAAALPGVPPEARRVARDTLGGASAEAARLANQAGAQLLETARTAFSQALQLTVIVCAVVSALTAVMVVVILGRVRTSPAAAGNQLH